MNASSMGCFGSGGNVARYPIRYFSGDWEAAASGRVSRPTMTTDREPDHPHGHLGEGWLAGSLAERRDAHQHGAA